MNKKAYSIAEAAESIGIGISKLREKIRANEIAVKYIDSTPIILATELDAYLESLPSEPR